MDDKAKTREQLVQELVGLRQEIARLEVAKGEHKRVEEALRESEEKYRELAESISDVFFAFDTNMRYTYWNKASEELTGIPAKDALGKHLYDIFPHAEMTRRAEEAYLKVLRTKQPQHFINEYQLGGKTFFFEISAYPTKNGLSVFTSDVTKRKRAEEELRSSHDYLEKLTNSMWDAVFSVRMPERVIEWANDSFRLIGYEPDECVGKTTLFLYPDERGFLTFGRKLKRAIAMGKDVLHTEQLLKRKNGELFPAEITTSFFKEKGEVVRVTSIVRDITERKRAEEELRQLTHELGKRVKELSCLYGISKLVENQDISLEGVLQGVVDLIPPAWRYPEITCARIAMGDKEFKADNFKTTEWMQTANIGTKRHKEGTIEVCYLQERPDIDEGPFSREERALIEAIAEVLGRVIERKRVEKTWRAFSRRLVEVQEGERRHIASELHDQIAQTLTEFNLLLETARRRSAEKARAKLSEAQALISELMERVSSMSLDLRPPMLDHLGLLPTLLWHFKRYAAQTQVRVDFMHTGLDGRFSPEVRLAAYRIVQEALTNVARHAGVREVTVRTWVDKGTLHVQVEDQGIGFNPEVALGTAVSSGLVGMRERAAWLGGKLVVESAPGVGFRVIAELPLEHPTEKVENEKGARRQ